MSKNGDDTRQRVLAAVNEIWRSRYESPTYREIMAATGISSTSQVGYHLDKLEYYRMIVRSKRGGIIPTWVAEAIREAIKAGHGQ
jgi:hypothetical protein